jgi:hypothetical protein
MTDHQPDQDDVLKELDAALQVEPSRAFADGVRARVNRSRANTTRVWWGLAAAASIGLATLALWRPATGPSVNDAPAIVTVAVAPAQVPAPVTPAAPAVPVARREPSVARASVTTIASEPNLVVITNQGAVLRELWAEVGTGAMVETDIEVPVPVTAAEMKPIAPIVLDPIVVTPIVVTEIGKDPRPEGATPVIRRADATKDATKETR